MFASLQAYSTLILVGCIFAAVAGGYFYITNLQKSVAILEANNKELTSAVDKQKEYIDTMKKDIALGKQMQDALRKSVIANTNDLNALYKKFDVSSASGKPRDFGNVASKNPAAVAKIINKGDAEANRCLEIASGSPLTEKEKNAKRKSEINTVCPNLANPAYISE